MVRLADTQDAAQAASRVWPFEESGLGIEYGAGEGMKEFLGVLCRGWRRGEAGETRNAQAAAPNLKAEILQEALCGDALGLGALLPLGSWQELAGGAQSGQQEQRVRGDLESRHGLAGSFVADLRLAHAQQSFLLAEVDLDIPTGKVPLHDLSER